MRDSRTPPAEARPASVVALSSESAPSPIGAARESGVQALIADIAARLALLSPQAVRAFALILDRFELGQRTYGAPSASRDWRADTLEELLDLCVYRGLTLACADPVERGLRELCENAPVAFDLSEGGEG